MQYMAKCPECGEKIGAGKEWSSKESRFRICPHCEAKLMRISTDAKPWTQIIAIVVLSPIIVSVAFSYALYQSLGLIVLLFPIGGIILMFIINAIQFPYTNTFVVYNEEEVKGREKAISKLLAEAHGAGVEIDADALNQVLHGPQVIAAPPASQALPTFKYHPDPIASECVVPSDEVCICCQQPRGYVYRGPVYAEGEYEDCICPWCIADGSASSKLGAEFTDAAGVGGGGQWEDVPKEVVDEVAYRTPGFAGWQQERWATHCGDACAFLGRMGFAELQARGPEASKAIQDETGLKDGSEWDEFYRVLDKDGSPTAYLFQCLHCGEYLGYTDCD